MFCSSLTGSGFQEVAPLEDEGQEPQEVEGGWGIGGAFAAGSPPVRSTPQLPQLAVSGEGDLHAPAPFGSKEARRRSALSCEVSRPHRLAPRSSSFTHLNNKRGKGGPGEGGPLAGAPPELAPGSGGPGGGSTAAGAGMSQSARLVPPHIAGAEHLVPHASRMSFSGLMRRPSSMTRAMVEKMMAQAHGGGGAPASSSLHGGIASGSLYGPLVPGGAQPGRMAGPGPGDSPGAGAGPGPHGGERANGVGSLGYGLREVSTLWENVALMGLSADDVSAGGAQNGAGPRAPRQAAGPGGGSRPGSDTAGGVRKLSMEAPAGAQWAGGRRALGAARARACTCTRFPCAPKHMRMNARMHALSWPTRARTCRRHLRGRPSLHPHLPQRRLYRYGQREHRVVPPQPAHLQQPALGAAAAQQAARLHAPRQRAAAGAALCHAANAQHNDWVT